MTSLKSLCKEKFGSVSKLAKILEIHTSQLGRILDHKKTTDTAIHAYLKSQGIDVELAPIGSAWCGVPMAKTERSVAYFAKHNFNQTA